MASLQKHLTVFILTAIWALRFWSKNMPKSQLHIKETEGDLQNAEVDNSDDLRSDLRSDNEEEDMKSLLSVLVSLGYILAVFSNRSWRHGSCKWFYTVTILAHRVTSVNAMLPDTSFPMGKLVHDMDNRQFEATLEKVEQLSREQNGEIDAQLQGFIDWVREVSEVRIQQLKNGDSVQFNPDDPVTKKYVSKLVEWALLYTDGDGNIELTEQTLDFMEKLKVIIEEDEKIGSDDTSSSVDIDTFLDTSSIDELEKLVGETTKLFQKTENLLKQLDTAIDTNRQLLNNLVDGDQNDQHWINILNNKHDSIQKYKNMWDSDDVKLNLHNSKQIIERFYEKKRLREDQINVQSTLNDIWKNEQFMWIISITLLIMVLITLILAYIVFRSLRLKSKLKKQKRHVPRRFIIAH